MFYEFIFAFFVAACSAAVSKEQAASAAPKSVRIGGVCTKASDCLIPNSCCGTVEKENTTSLDGVTFCIVPGTVAGEGIRVPFL